MSNAAKPDGLLGRQPKPDGAALTTFVVDDADLESGRVVLRVAPQPAFKNLHRNVQGGSAGAMIDGPFTATHGAR